MAESLHRRARAVFLELTTLDGPAISIELDRLVGDDAALRAAVVSLLDARQDANQAGLMTADTGSRHSAPITESAGTIIGPYKILQLIGEGGFGSVFLAEQAEPVRRRVALKIIKLGMDTKQVIARFEAERQALALMDHPHIARVFDAGATASGRPYFAMEHVVGDAITKFADDYKLDIDARLRLLAQVCSAVQHAHTKGVIHRDLKPANVLVSMVDGKPFARVIDFGIAKATASPLTHKTLFTEHRQLIGTPEYMSPEQAEGSPDIDTRTDVYALGVLLYELLTGATPFDATRLRSAAWGEMQRIIREEEPPIPSMRLSRDAALSQRTAANRQTEPPRLASSIRGELDWIVMKALDKDRGRRYTTPSDLAEDIGKHLSGDAVEAAPPSTAYKLRKFVRRNRGPVVAGVSIAVVLLLGIAGTTAGLLIAQHNADVAIRHASAAQWSAYTANLALAQNAMDAGDWLGARAFLEQCPDALRGWEWALLNKRANATRWSFNNAVATQSADGDTLFLFPDESSQASLIDTTTGGELFQLRVEAGHVRDAAFSPDSEVILTTGSNISYLFSARTGRTLATIPGVIGAASSHSFSSDSSRFVLMHRDGIARVYDATNGSVVMDLTSAAFPATTNGHAAYIPGTSSAVLVAQNLPIRIVDTLPGTLVRDIPGPPSYVQCLAMSPDATRFAVVRSNAVDVWNIQTGTKAWTAERPSEYFVDAEFSADAATLITISAQDDSDIYADAPYYWTWDAVTGNALDRRASDHSAFRDSRREFESIGAIYKLTRDGRTLLHELQLHELHIESMASLTGGSWIRGEAITTPDGTRRITLSSRNKIQFSEAQSDRHLIEFHTEEPIDELMLSADGTILLARTASGSAHVWDVRTPQQHRADAREQWNARQTASEAVDRLWGSATPTSGLPISLLHDDSLAPTTRLVAGEMLYDRLVNAEKEVARVYRRLSDGHTDKTAVLKAANDAQLHPRLKTALLTKAEAWEYHPPQQTKDQQLSDETRRRRLAEASLALTDFFSWETIPGHLDPEMIAEALAARVELLGEQHPLTSQTRWLYGMLLTAKAGRVEEGLESCRLAADSMLSSPESDPFVRIGVVHNLMQTELRYGTFEEAEARFNQLLALLQSEAESERDDALELWQIEGGPYGPFSLSYVEDILPTRLRSSIGSMNGIADRGDRITFVVEWIERARTLGLQGLLASDSAGYFIIDIGTESDPYELVIPNSRLVYLLRLIPDAVGVKQAQSLALLRRGDFREAVRLAIEVEESNADAGKPQLALPVAVQAIAAARLGEQSEAEELRSRLVAIKERTTQERGESDLIWWNSIGRFVNSDRVIDLFLQELDDTLAGRPPVIE
ncbi:MAG: protein kinase domain-containing protein [Phycisphaerales bacterium]